MSGAETLSMASGWPATIGAGIGPEYSTAIVMPFLAVRRGWVDVPAPSPPSGVMRRPLATASATGPPDQVPERRGDAADRPELADRGPGIERVGDILHVRCRDPEHGERLAGDDRCRDRAGILDGDRHALLGRPVHRQEQIGRASCREGGCRYV